MDRRCELLTRLTDLVVTSAGAAVRLEPPAQAPVDLGVVQQRKVVRGADVVAVFVLERDPPSAAPSGSAGRQHEDVAK